MKKLTPTIKKTTPSFEDMINQGYSANQNISLPIQGNISESVMPNNSPPIFQNASMYMLPEENKPASDYDFLSNILSPKTNQKPITQPIIEEDEDTGRGGIGIGQALAQSLAMLGAGVRGGDVGQVGRMFDLNRQESFRQGQYQKQKAEQKQKIKEQENTAKQYVDPNSEISIQERAKAKELYGDAISDKFSYADLQNRFVREAIEKKYNAIQEQKNLEEQKGLQSRLDDPKSPETLKLKNSLKLLGINVPEGLSYNEIEKNKSRLEKLSEPKPIVGGGVRGGGVAQEKPEKEVKSNQKSIAEYRDHVASLSEMGTVIDDIKKLNRTRLGSITPDFDINTQAISSSLDRAAQPMIKALAGPGTLQPEERETYGKLVPKGNTRSDLALMQANDIIIKGTIKSLAKMNSDISTGDLSQKDYNALINQYNEQLTKKGVGVNQVINPSTGQLEPRQRKEAELKDGRKVIIDQFGYTWE
jgi:hypothetical protein